MIREAFSQEQILVFVGDIEKQLMVVEDKFNGKECNPYKYF